MMTKRKGPRVVRAPTDDELRQAFEAYATAVGKVAYAWNYFQERLGAIFCSILGFHEYVGFAIWYSSDNDRTQRLMLKALIPVSERRMFKSDLPANATADLDWLINRANELAELRNDAVHAPCSAYTGPDGTEMKAAIISGYHGHKRAKRLIGKQLLVEFDWLERYAELLSRFAIAINLAINDPKLSPWPSRPVAPTRNPKKAYLTLHRQTRSR